VVRIRGLSPYGPLWDLQRFLWSERLEGETPDVLLLLEHTPVITLGKSADAENLRSPREALDAAGVEVVEVDRGGDVTYHGPGQITGYLIADLKELALDLHLFVRALEEVMIRTLAAYEITAGRIPGLTGVWVGGEKIGAIGVHMSRWISTHGFAFNIETDLDSFDHIVPCGIDDRGVTSMARLRGGAGPDLEEVARSLGESAGRVFHRRTSWITFNSAGDALCSLGFRDVGALQERSV
jgi:lipoyl(octanoyl) transferase